MNDKSMNDATGALNKSDVYASKLIPSRNILKSM